VTGSRSPPTSVFAGGRGLCYPSSRSEAETPVEAGGRGKPARFRGAPVAGVSAANRLLSGYERGARPAAGILRAKSQATALEGGPCPRGGRHPTPLGCCCGSGAAGGCSRLTPRTEIPSAANVPLARWPMAARALPALGGCSGSPQPLGLCGGPRAAQDGGVKLRWAG